MTVASFWAGTSSEVKIGTRLRGSTWSGRGGRGFGRITGGDWWVGDDYLMQSGEIPVIALAYDEDLYAVDTGSGMAEVDFPDIHVYAGASLALQKDISGNVVFKPHNLLKSSQNLSNGTHWVEHDMTGVTGVDDPSGGTNGVTFTEATTDTDHGFTSPAANRVTVVKSETWHCEAYLLRAMTRRYVVLVFHGSLITVDTQAGAITEEVEASQTITSSGIEVIGDWYRVFFNMTVKVTSGGVTTLIRGTTSATGNNSSPTYLGDASTIVAWGMQANRTPMAPALDTTFVSYVPSTADPIFQHRLDHDVSGNQIGLLKEAAATSICLQAHDLTEGVWNTVTNMTPLKDQTGADGIANSASSLLATAANAIITQAITSGSAERVYYAFVKRLIGTGNVEMTQDGGSTWADIKADINSSTYTQVGVVAATVTNPVVGFRLVTDTDKIAVQFCDSVIGDHISSPIGALTIPVTRLGDDAPVATSEWDFSATIGTLYGVVTPNHLPASELILFSLNDGTTNEVIEVYIDSSANVKFRVTDGGVDQCDIDSLVNAVAGTELKIAVSWAASDFAISVDGNTIAVDTGGTLPTVTSLDQCEDGIIASLAQYQATVSDADLVARTA